MHHAIGYTYWAPLSFGITYKMFLYNNRPIVTFFMKVKVTKPLSKKYGIKWWLEIRHPSEWFSLTGLLWIEKGQPRLQELSNRGDFERINPERIYYLVHEAFQSEIALIQSKNIKAGSSKMVSSSGSPQTLGNEIPRHFQDIFKDDFWPSMLAARARQLLY